MIYIIYTLVVILVVTQIRQKLRDLCEFFFLGLRNEVPGTTKLLDGARVQAAQHLHDCIEITELDEDLGGLEA